MSLDFEKYAIKGNEFVQLVADELKIPKDIAGRVIRAVFHSLRNRLTHEESFHLLAQLPLVLKGVFVDGWKFDTEFQRIKHLEDFLNEVRKEDGSSAGYDFGNDARAKITVSAVFKALHYFISEGELNNMIAVLPNELKKLIKESVGGTETVL